MKINSLSCLKSYLYRSAQALLAFSVITIVQPAGVFSQQVEDTPGPTRKLILVSDNQENLLTSAPLRSMSGLADKFVSVAVRSPLANVGGRLLMREAIQSGKQMGGDIVVHLGDASNISCPDELSAVFDALNAEAGDAWFMAPGNHDGFLAGTFDYSVLDDFGIYSRPPNKPFKLKERFTWLDGCTVPSRYGRGSILTRGESVEQFVGTLKKRQGYTASVRSKEQEVQTINLKKVPTIELQCEFETIKSRVNNFSAYARICGRENKFANNPDGGWIGPQHSFIVQKLDIDDRRIILLDTSNYEDPADFSEVAEGGSLTDRQMNAVDQNMLASRSGGRIDRSNVIMAGHHPFNELPEPVRNWIAERAARYMSGHKHERATRSVRRAITGSVTELNIGSTLDHPPQMVLAEFGRDSIYVTAFGAETKELGFLKPCVDQNRDGGWRLPNIKLYTKYRNGPYAGHLLTALREASSLHDRLITDPHTRVTIPSGNNIRDWFILETVLAKINAAEGESRSFWACQAYYASDATKGEGKLERFVQDIRGKTFKYDDVVDERRSF